MSAAIRREQRKEDEGYVVRKPVAVAQPKPRAQKSSKAVIAGDAEGMRLKLETEEFEIAVDLSLLSLNIPATKHDAFLIHASHA